MGGMTAVLHGMTAQGYCILPQKKTGKVQNKVSEGRQRGLPEMAKGNLLTDEIDVTTEKY